MMKKKRRNAGCVLFRVVAGFMIIFMLSGCGNDHVSYEPADVTDDADAQVTEQQTDESSATSENTGYVYVYVCGAVRQEGVYRLPEGSRINDALILAGTISCVNFSCSPESIFHHAECHTETHPCFQSPLHPLLQTFAYYLILIFMDHLTCKEKAHSCKQKVSVFHSVIKSVKKDTKLRSP